MLPPLFPSKSRNHASQNHLLCPVSDDCSQEGKICKEDGVPLLEMVVIVSVGRFPATAWHKLEELHT